MSKKFAFIFFLILIVLNYSYNLKAEPNLRNPRVLFIVPNEFGANTNLNKDNLENLGWDITFTGTKEIVDPCPSAKVLGLKPFSVDSLISEINLSLNYDAVIVTSASSWTSNPCGDLIESSDVTNVLRTAANNRIVVAAYCTSVRVLAKAGILNGKRITGNGNFTADYQAGGAIFEGANLLPIIDGNIVTSTRGDFYYLQNSNAIEDAIEMIGYNNSITEMSSPVHIYNSEFYHEDIIWARTFGGKASELSSDMIELEDASVIILGSTYSEGNGFSDILIKKVSSDGIELWSKTIGGEKRDFGSSIILHNNYLYAAGTTTSFGAGKKDISLSKLSLNGDLIWTKYYGGHNDETCRKIISSSDNNLIILADSYSFGNGEDDALVIKIDNEGEHLFSKSFGYIESEMVFDIINTSDNNFVFVGASGHFSDKRDIWINKIDQNGNLIWENSFGENDNNDWAFKLIEHDSSFYLTGKSDNHGVDFYNSFLLKTDWSGNQIYFNKFGEIKLYEFGHTISITDDHLVISGIEKSYETSNDIFVVSVSFEGEVLEQELLSSSFITNLGNDWVTNLIVTQDKNFLVSGHTNSLGAGSFDIFLMKLTSLIPNFDTDKRTGHAPLEINFQNNSSGPEVISEWDFENDNFVDNVNKNPSHTFSEPGFYSPKLSITDGIISKYKLKENYIKIFDGESCLSFLNSDSRMIFKKESVIDLNKNFSIELWIYQDELSYQKYFLDKETISISTIGNSIFYDSCFVIQIEMESGAKLIASTPDNSFKNGEWQHFSLSFSENEMFVFINGINQELKIRSGIIDGAIKSNLENDLILGNRSTLLKNFDGMIDEFRIWNKPRSASEILNDYKKYLYGNEDNLTSYFQFNEGNGQIANSKINNESQKAELVDPDWNQSIYIDKIVKVNQEEIIPNTIILYQNYPNPFNPTTSIEYSVPNNEYVSLKVFDILGNEVSTLVNEQKSAGNYKVSFDASNLVSGMYIYKIQAGEFSQVRKMMLLK